MFNVITSRLSVTPGRFQLLCQFQPIWSLYAKDFSISILKTTVLGYGFLDGLSNSNLANIFETRIPLSGNFSNDEDTETTQDIFDSRLSRQYPGGGTDQIMNINSYGGSTFDNIYPFTLNNISGKDSSDLQTAFLNGTVPDSLHPELNDGLSDNGYDEYTYDPRTTKIGVLPNITVGQPDINCPNPKNPYKGCIFDDPLFDGIEGGGLFNDSTHNHESQKPVQLDIASLNKKNILV